MKFLLLLMLPAALIASEPMPKAQWDFVSRYCTDCHDEDMNEGELNLDFEKVDWTSKSTRHHWEDVYTMLERGKMPPKKKKKQPTSAEKKQFLSWLDQQLVKHSPIGGTTVRRLNKREYETTVRSVFNMYNFTLPLSFPQDNTSHGFDTMGESLVVSPSHLEAYAETAIKVADYILPPEQKPIAAKKWLINPKDMTISYSSAYIVDGAMRLGATGSKTRTASWPTRFEAPATGIYKVSLMLSTKNPPKNQLPIFHLRAHKSGKGSKERALGEYKIKAGKAQVFSAEVKLYKGENILFKYGNSPYSFEKGKVNILREFLIKEFSAKPRMAAAWKKLGKVPRGGNGWARVKKAMADPKLDISKYKPKSPAVMKAVDQFMKDGVSSGETLIYHYFEEGPNIGIHKVAVQGPLKLIEDDEQKTQKEVTKSFLGDLLTKSDDASIKKFLQSYLTKTFRRPATSKEVDNYFKLIKQEMANGYSLRDGIHLAIRTSLITPSFLYRERGEGELSDFELASRLSYFLMSGPPDYQLNANASQLRNPKTLRAQAEKLLKSGKSRYFIHDFTSQWLDTKELETIMPDPALYRKFGFAERKAMIGEVEMTFKEILTKNLSLMDFIDPNYVYTTGLIGSQIYQLPKVKANKSNKLKKYPIKKGTRHGGILGMPAVMMATANGVDTQPVLRGVWLLENVLGTPPPEPPKAVPALPPDTSAAISPKQKLAAHMNTASCASCHVDIDPLGFVLENFNPVGKWRTNYPGKNKKKKGLKVDSTGVMPDGTKLNDVTDLKKYLVSKPELFTNCLAEKLMTYATGRELNYHEKKIISGIVDNNIKNGNRFKDLLLDLISSKVFYAR